MKKGFQSKTLTYVLAGVLALLLIGITTLVLTNKVVISDVFSGKRKVEITVMKMGDKFYQEFYHHLVTVGKTPEETANVLKDKEIKVSVAEIRRLKEIDTDELWSSLSDVTTKYDWEQSTVAIRPLAPFGSKDYKIEAELVETVK